MRSPKITAPASPTWYSYYAGYSTEFVDDVIDAAHLSSGATILDPWNGSGTTTARALARGFSARGYDVNPALVIIARGRLLGKNVLGSVPAMTQDILQAAQQSGPSERSSDGLRRWFNAGSAGRIRAIEESVQRLLVDHETYLPISDRDPEKLSAIASFFYVSIFEAVRSLLACFVGTNPTWIKSPTTKEELLSVSWKILREELLAATERLSQRIEDGGLSGATPVPEHQLEVANSAQLPIDADTVDLVIGSPPYCTRIDYVMATLPELAVLGYGADSAIAELRRSMIGTPTMHKNLAVADDQRFGDTATQFLNDVRNHDSRASGTYYLKYFYQYFLGMADSLAELRRVTAPDARAVLVVQDSYYKEVHNDLAQAVIDMGAGLGWTLVDRSDFKARNKAAINPGSRSYRSTFEASESVITLG